MEWITTITNWIWRPFDLLYMIYEAYGMSYYSRPALEYPLLSLTDSDLGISDSDDYLSTSSDSEDQTYKTLGEVYKKDAYLSSGW